MPLKTLLLDDGALAEAAPRCAARLARVQMETALVRALPLLRGDPPAIAGDALHDFRVALRRLRSTLRGWRPQLPGVPERKEKKRLRKISRSAGAVRDLELRIQTLREHQAVSDRNEREALVPLLEQLGAELRRRQTGFQSLLGRRLGKTLGRLQKELVAAEAATGEPARDALQSLIRDQWQVLEQALTVAPELDDVKGPHRARIAAKHLRYLLEPLAGIGPADQLVEALTGLQDQLGTLHDRQLSRSFMRDAGAVPALQPLRRRFDKEAAASAAAARKLLRPALRRRLSHQVEALRRQLRRAS